MVDTPNECTPPGRHLITQHHVVYLHNDLFEDTNGKLKLPGRAGRDVCVAVKSTVFAVNEVNRLGMLRNSQHIIISTSYKQPDATSSASVFNTSLYVHVCA